jgi:ketosteroid isomerase-like protein
MTLFLIRRSLMSYQLILPAAASLLLCWAVAADAQTGLTEQVRSAETAFARSMADRDAAAFASLIGDEAVFFGSKDVMRGKDAVVAGWKRFFDGASAPFSWKPAEVEVLASGTLGMTSGPVFDPQGRRIGTFNSIWQRQADGSWKVIFDKGCPPCDCAAKP